MMAGTGDLETIAQFLSQTLNPATRKQAEQALSLVEPNPQFALLLMQIIEKSADTSVKSCAAIYFKNFIKRRWSQKVFPFSSLTQGRRHPRYYFSH